MGIECYSREGKQITPSKRTIAVRLLSGAFPINYKYGITSRNAPPPPYGRYAHSIRDREVYGFIVGEAFRLPIRAFPWYLSVSFVSKYFVERQIRLHFLFNETGAVKKHRFFTAPYYVAWG